MRKPGNLSLLLTLAVLLPLGLRAVQPNAKVLELILLSRKSPHSGEFRAALIAALGEKEVKEGTAVMAEGPDFLWAVESDKPPILWVNEEPFAKMTRSQGSNLWFHSNNLRTGRTHMFHYVVEGKRFGGKNNVLGWGKDVYRQPGVPQGTLSEMMVHASNIYPGMKTNYWIYVPAQYDPATPAALMVWQDGEVHVDREKAPTLDATDNLIQQGAIPVMIHVFISPGMAGERRMRSIEYDTVDDTYPRFLRDEILPEVYKRYNIRRDSYSRGIAGESSGGICAFNAAWMHPEQFSRVISRIGSFTSIQWKPGQLEGGNVYPFKVRKEAKRNIRVWLQEGSEDLENSHGSWPLQNLQLANSLKIMDYDFHLSWANGAHTGTTGHVEVAEELIWLWRDYDPAKTAQTYEMEEAEKVLPVFRVQIGNR